MQQRRKYRASWINGKGHTILNVLIIRKGLPKKVTFELSHENDDKAIIWIPGNRAFQEEEIVGGKRLDNHSPLWREVHTWSLFKVRTSVPKDRQIRKPLKETNWYRKWLNMTAIKYCDYHVVAGNLKWNFWGFFVFFFFGLFRATLPAAYGGSQAAQIWASSATYTTLTATQLLNLLSEARDQTCILMDTSQICFHWATTGTPKMKDFNGMCT